PALRTCSACRTTASPKRAQPMTRTPGTGCGPRPARDLLPHTGEAGTASPFSGPAATTPATRPQPWPTAPAACTRPGPPRLSVVRPSVLDGADVRNCEISGPGESPSARPTTATPENSGQ